YVFASLFQFIQQYMMAAIAQRTVYDLRAEVFEKVDHLPLFYFDGRSHVDILSRVRNDVETIAATLQQRMTQIISSYVTHVGTIIMMLWISPLLTLIAVISIPLSIFVIRPLIKKSQTNFSDQQRTLGNLNGHVEEMYTGHQVVKAYGQEAVS